MSEISPWEARLEIDRRSVEMIVLEGQRMVLETHGLGRPRHPRALLSILEGLALWHRKRMYVVISAERVVHPSLGLGNRGDEWPEEHPLLEYLHVVPAGSSDEDSGRERR